MAETMVDGVEPDALTAWLRRISVKLTTHEYEEGVELIWRASRPGRHDIGRIPPDIGPEES